MGLVLAPDYACDINVQSADGETPLMTALEAALHTAAVHLIRAGADLFLRNRFHETALHIACRKGLQLPIQCMLSQTICPVDVPDLNGNTPLHLAASRGFVTIVQQLLQYSAVHVQSVNVDGLRPEDLAFEGGFDKIAQVLRRWSRS